MGSDLKKQIIIPKEKAVFWMDRNGTWHNEHGPFEHPRIIKYFNSSIRKDENGYYVHQSTDEFDEKVYFQYEDTALFVIGIMFDEKIYLKLNNGSESVLNPLNLFSKDDSLYIEEDGNLIKFTSNAMLKIAKYLTEENGKLYFCLNGEKWPVE